MDQSYTRGVGYTIEQNSIESPPLKPWKGLLWVLCCRYRHKGQGCVRAIHTAPTLALDTTDLVPRHLYGRLNRRTGIFLFCLHRSSVNGGFFAGITGPRGSMIVVCEWISPSAHCCHWEKIGYVPLRRKKEDRILRWRPLMSPLF